jgi:hypothetical protein
MSQRGGKSKKGDNPAVDGRALGTENAGRAVFLRVTMNETDCTNY